MENLSNTPDYELLDRFLDVSNPDAERAYTELYNRHSGFMLNVAMKLAYDRFPRQGRETAEDIFGESLEKWFKNRNKFKKAHALSPQKQRNHLRTWLYRIVERVFIDYVKKQFDTVELEDAELEILGLHEDNDLVVHQKLSPRREKLMLAIQSAAAELSERESEVLRAFVRYGTFDDHGNWILDPQIMDVLCKRYILKPNSVNQLRKRTIEKIKSRISSTDYENQRENE